MAAEGITDAKLLQGAAYVAGGSVLARWGLSALGPEGWAGYKVEYNIFDNPHTGFYEAADIANAVSALAALVALYAFSNIVVNRVFGPEKSEKK